MYRLFTDSSSLASGLESIDGMTDEQPQEFMSDLARDLKMREWKHIGNDFEVVLSDCPENMNGEACGPFTCRG